MANINIVKGEIGNALTSVAPNHILGVANDIFDENQQRYQQDINTELLGRSEGVYDISAEHLTEGNPTQYATLSEALGTNGANIPADKRKGGMSVKFVSSSDHKYVQYFLTKNEWSASDADWEKMNLEEDVSQLSQEIPVYSGTLDKGTVYNEVNVNSRVNTLYSIPNVNATYKIRVTGLTNVTSTGSSKGLKVFISDSKSVYSSAVKQTIAEYFIKDTDWIEFTIKDSVKSVAQYIGVTSIDTSSCSFKVELLMLRGDIQLTERSTGLLIGNGTFTDKYSDYNRTCAFYPIPNKDGLYNIKVDVNANESGGDIIIVILKKISYSASDFLYSFKVIDNHADILIQIPENVKNTANYIGIIQNTASANTVSFTSEIYYYDKGRTGEKTIRLWNGLTMLEVETYSYVVNGAGNVSNHINFTATDFFKLKAGQTIVVGNAYSNIACIYKQISTNPLEEGTAVVEVLEASELSDNDYHEFSYTATESEENIGICFYNSAKHRYYTSNDTLIIIKDCLTTENSNF